MNEKQRKSLIVSFSIVVVIGIIIGGNIMYFGTDWFKPGGNSNP